MPMPAISLAAVPGRRAAALDIARRAEERGFSGIYCPSFGDGMGLCLALAQATSTIPFGTSIANIYARRAADFAQSAAFIHELSEGRFRFGIGVSHRPMNERLGVTAGRPLRDVADFVESVRSAKRVGETPPIVVAALRDRMAALAAEIGDGAVWANASRNAMAGSIERMRSAHPVADDFFIGNMIPVCITDDHEAAMAVHRRTLTMYVGLPNYRNYWHQAGYADEMDAIAAAIADGDRDAVPGLMSEAWLRDVTLFGPADEVREGLQAWFDAGVTTPILVPSSAVGNQLVAFDELFALFE